MTDLLKYKVDLNEMSDHIETTIFYKWPIKIVMSVYLRSRRPEPRFSAYVGDKYVPMSECDNLGTTVKMLNNALEYPVLNGIYK